MTQDLGACERILLDRPFGLSIKTIRPLTDGNSGEAFWVRTAAGRQFKLRQLSTALDARRTEDRLKHGLEAGVCPPVHARDGPYLLVRWMDDHRPSGLRSDLRRARLIGAACARMDRAAVTLPMGHADGVFDQMMCRLRDDGGLDAALSGRLRRTYARLRRGASGPAVLGLIDVHPLNFVFTPRRACFIDEHSLCYLPKGLGLIRPLLRWSPELVRELLAGYRRLHSLDYMTPEHRAFLLVYDRVREVRRRVRQRRSLRRDEQDLERLIACPERLPEGPLHELFGHVERILRPGYVALRNRVRRVVEGLLPRGATVLVVGRGDHAMLEFDGRRGEHFPQQPGGRYSGHHPADSREAIRHLERLRGKGSGYLLLPRTSFWWLDHYDGFRRHLNRCYRRLHNGKECVIYSLRRRSRG